MSLITTNINVTTVKNSIGEITNAISLLCKSAYINIWSRCKPVVGTFPQSDGKYGFTLPLYTAGAFNPLNWTYNIPTSDFRLGDFRGYEHNSSLTFPPIYVNSVGQNENTILSPSQPSGGVSSGGVISMMLVSASAVRLSLNELNLSSYYFGILIVTPAGTKYIKTNSATIATGNETTGIGVNYSAALNDPTNTNSTYQDLPYGVGTFTAYYVISSTNFSTWTIPTGTIYKLPSGSVVGLSFKNSFSFSVTNWTYAETGSLSFPYSYAGQTNYLATRIFCSSGAAPFSINLNGASWCSYRVYDSSNTGDITNSPSTWYSGCYLRVYPITANTGDANNNIIYVNGTNATPYPISLTQQAAPARVVPTAYNPSIMTISSASGNVSGGLNITFTPYYIPNNDPTFYVGYRISVNGVQTYAPATATIPCTQNQIKTTTLAYGSTAWADGDLITVELAYEYAPPVE